LLNYIEKGKKWLNIHAVPAAVQAIFVVYLVVQLEELQIIACHAVVLARCDAHHAVALEICLTLAARAMVLDEIQQATIAAAAMEAGE
jgi:hypothetical protein